MGPWLAYAKGGVALADVQMTTQFQVQPTTYNRTPFGAVAEPAWKWHSCETSPPSSIQLMYFPPEHLVFINHTTVSSIDHFVQVVKGGNHVRFGGDQTLPR